ncbi:MAG: hypothetical protein P8N43_07715 [Alphaproteobacteria bacterium]|jgi:hypothetical protein|nr:hypothetical protein [Alphaproteobacteria bacterium]
MGQDISQNGTGLKACRVGAILGVRKNGVEYARDYYKILVILAKVHWRPG